MTVKTRVITLFLDRTHAEYLPLPDGLKLQILPSIRHLPNCQKHHFAAFVRDSSLLIVWQDDPKMLLEKARSIESQLMDVIWMADEHRKSNSSGLHDQERATVFPVAAEIEDGMEGPRPLKLNQAAMVALTLILSITALGAGWRQVAIETSVDHSFSRLTLGICVPFQLWLAQVSHALFYIVPTEPDSSSCSQSSAPSASALVLCNSLKKTLGFFPQSRNHVSCGGPFPMSRSNAQSTRRA
jgi:hypothetical protein